MKFKKIAITVLTVIIVFWAYSKTQMTVTEVGFLDTHLDEIEAKIKDRDILNDSVSKVSVAWHLDHSLKVINRIYESLEASDPSQFESSFNFSRVLSLTFNYIPRGRAKSPKAVLPPENITVEALYKQLDEARSKMDKALDLPKESHFKHPVFGTISRGNALRFIEVHTQHHLKIMRDILEE